jgi:hypothetical protein
VWLEREKAEARLSKQSLDRAAVPELPAAPVAFSGLVAFYRLK